LLLINLNLFEKKSLQKRQFLSFSERDNLEHDRLESQRQLTILEGAHQTLQKERDELHSDV
jgi:hypothetical protein